MSLRTRIPGVRKVNTDLRTKSLSETIVLSMNWKCFAFKYIFPLPYPLKWLRNNNQLSSKEYAKCTDSVPEIRSLTKRNCKKWMILNLGQEIDKVNLEHLIICNKESIDATKVVPTEFKKTQRGSH